MRPEFRGWGAGLQPGQGCPQMEVCPGRADHRCRRQDPGPCALIRSGGHGCFVSLRSRTATGVTGLPSTGTSPAISKSTGQWG